MREKRGGIPAAIGHMLTIAALLLSLAAAPQEIPPPRVDQAIEVELVNVDVFVTDKKGNRVRGLKPEDFVIKESGRVQPITNFAEYSSGIQDVKLTSGVDAPALPQADQQVAEAAPPRKRTIVVFVEVFKLPNFRVEPMFASIRSMLRDVVRPGDDVAIYSWDRGLSQRLGFTDDHAAIDSTLAEIEKECIGVEGSLVETLRQMRELEANFYASLDAASQGGTSAAKGSFVAAAAQASERSQFHERGAALTELAYIRRKAADMRMLLRTIGDSPGRKIMLTLTNRFGTHAGAQYFSDGQVSSAMWPTLETRREREQLIAAANMYNVTLYPVYPAGLGSTSRVTAMQGQRTDIFKVDSDADMRVTARDHNVLLNETTSLNEIARGTGGLLAWGHKDIMELLPRIEDDLETYYSLAYQPAPGAKRGKLEIEVKDRRYTVRSRREFLMRDEATKMEDRVIANLTREVEGTTIPLTVEFGPYKRQSRFAWTVPLKLRIPVAALTALPGDEGRVGEFSVYVAVGGDPGVLSEVQRGNQRFKITDEQAAQVEGAYFTYEFTLQVRPLAGRVSIGVIDEVSKEFGAQVVDLPNFPSTPNNL